MMYFNMRKDSKKNTPANLFSFFLFKRFLFSQKMVYFAPYCKIFNV